MYKCNNYLNIEIIEFRISMLRLQPPQTYITAIVIQCENIKSKNRVGR